MVVQPFDAEVASYYNRQLNVWLDFVDISKVKAFVELSVSDSVRAGARNLLTVSAGSSLSHAVMVTTIIVCWTRRYEA